MNKFRHIQRICEKVASKDIPKTNEDTNPTYNLGFFEGQKELAQQILKEVFGVLAENPDV